MGNMIIGIIIVIWNSVGGMIVEWNVGIFIVIYSYFINNSVNGLEILDSSFLLCNLYGLFSKENEGSGLYFYYVVFFNSNVFYLVFVGNGYNGIVIVKSVS